METQHTRDVHDFRKLFNPASIAVIGASQSEEKPGGIILRRIAGRGRRVYPVHPKAEELLGLPVYHSISSLPDGIDLAVITVSAEKAVEAAEECAGKRIPFVIVVAGGFGEAGRHGKQLEQRLRMTAQQGGTRILGPNSLGIFVPEYAVDTIFVEHGDKALAGGGGVAFITQSGSVGVEALGLASNTGFGMRAFVGIGNKCDLNELDFLRYFGSDPGSNCLAFYVENLETGREFLSGAKTVTQKKPVIVLKAGRTAAGASAVSSHTGRLAGSDQVINGAFRQFGIQRAYDDEELCDAAKALSSLPPAPGNRIAVLTPAGGYGVMCADYIEAENRRAPLRMAVLQPETRKRITEATVPYASTSNPVDVTASADNAMIINSLDALLDDSGVDIIICIAFFAPPTINENLIPELAVRTAAAEKPIIVFTQYGPFTEEYLRKMYSSGIIGFPSVGRTVRAARVLVERMLLLESLEEHT